MFRSFDKDKDSAISFEEFLLIILSRAESDLRALVSQKDTYYIGNHDYLSYEVEYCLAKIYEKELNYIDQFVDYSIEVRKCIDFNEKRAFKLIDYLDYDLIEEKGLEHFLRKKGFYLNKNELTSLLNRLDSDGDNLVNFKDFKEIFYLNNEKTHSNMEYDQSIIQPSRLNISSGGLRTSFEVSKSKFPKKEDFGNLSTLTSNQTFKQTFDNINLMSSLNSYTSPKVGNKTMTNFSSGSVKKSNLVYNESIHSRNFMRSTSPKSNIIPKSRQSKIKSLLVQLLQDFIYTDSILETAKQELILKKDFKLNEIFKNFDIGLKGHINTQDFLNVIRNLGLVSYTLEDIKLLFGRYDIDSDGKMK